jgi:GT2 family glycosyltransferase
VDILNSIDKKIAVLITCHNRREKTINCLRSLFEADLDKNYKLDIFLVDDGSTDGTSELVKAHFPKVKIIKGSGSLYWNGGMRLAWEVASKAKEFDFYLWLNDDTILKPFALNNMLLDYEKILKKTNNKSLIAGACHKQGTTDFSYGGLNKNGPIIPNGEPQECKYINGNIVLIPKAIYDKIGNLSSNYTHAIGDYDYGLRAQNAGFGCYTTSSFISECSNNPIPAWEDPKTPLWKRFALLYSPHGLNIKEFIKFTIYHQGKFAVIPLYIKIYLKVLSPKFYNFLKYLFNRGLLLLLTSLFNT